MTRKFILLRGLKISLFFSLLFCSYCYTEAADQEISADSTAADSIVKLERSPVIFFSDTVYFISTKLGPYSSSERAINQSNKLEALLENELFDTLLLSTSEDAVAVEILHGEQVIGSVTQADADLLNKSKSEVAEEYIASIKRSFATNYDQNN